MLLFLWSGSHAAGKVGTRRELKGASMQCDQLPHARKRRHGYHRGCDGLCGQVGREPRHAVPLSSVWTPAVPGRSAVRTGEVISYARASGGRVHATQA
eukprot:COSAG01_NODE_241_length_20597_cov_8.200751_5_plen_98_part_00